MFIKTQSNSLKYNLLAYSLLIGFTVFSQGFNTAIPTDYWQQQADYEMEVDMDVKNYQYKGNQILKYTNNAPDVLYKVYYHLYFNAFQPGSEMDIRSLTIKDPDPRVGNRISQLKPKEIGYIKVNNLEQNGTKIKYETVGTILEVNLAKPIQPGETVVFKMNFEAQVPLQIRRSGRNNEEGVALSMTQWYPKIAAYDDEGWHADPYIGREFYSDWGNYDVKLTIDKNYTVGGTGYLISETKAKGKKKTLHFNAPNVHDFAWAADPDFQHDSFQMPNGPTLNFYYKKNLDNTYITNWKKLQEDTAKLMTFYNENIGNYPYKQYSVIQGGDGGMEYAMCTLITGKRNYGSLLGVTAHELAHTWFQFLLATNEAKHEWMDEGFTSYYSSLALNEIQTPKKDFPIAPYYNGYIGLAKSGIEQPLTTHADRYAYNSAYGAAAYSKGAVFMAQLGYIIGEDNLAKTVKKFFADFAFKHPKPIHFIRTAEFVTNFELDWYLIDFAQTTNTIDYAVKSVENNLVTLERIGLMPMPIDLKITYTDGSSESFYIPLQMMRGEKPTEATILKDWAWAYPTYSFKTSKTIKLVEIDPLNQMADLNKNNNMSKTE